MENTNENRVVLVTGASRGIGAAIAIHMAKQGYIVVGTATGKAGIDKIAQNAAAHEVSIHGLILNVTDTLEGLAKQLASIVDHCGKMPDILVNNAGVCDDGLLMRMKIDQWQNVIDTNLTSAYRLSKICLRPMIQLRWGRIINIGSVVGTTGNAGQTNYAAAKAGLIGFSRSLAQEVAARNITVNVVAPGFIETDMTQALNDVQQESILGSVPMQRMGKPDEIASLVAYLSSDMAAYITGELIHVNGGLLMA